MKGNKNNKRTKVTRLIDKYDLDGMGAQLEADWTGVSGERTSLRDLADEFNYAILEAALRAANVSPAQFELSGIYTALADSGAEQTRAKRRLEREGVCVDDLLRDFVTHQAIYTYLTEYREASLPEHTTDTVEKKVEAIKKLQGRLAVVIDSAISSSASTGSLDHSDYDVLIDVRVICPACGSDSTVGTLLREGGCDCDNSSHSQGEN